MELIYDLYNIILQPIDIIYKLTAIHKCKAHLNIGRDERFGEYYYKKAEKKKSTGVVYTPMEIAEYIVKNVIIAEDIIKNPFSKILDPACGTGNFIIPAYEYLKEIFEENLININRGNNLKLKVEDIPKHIVNNNLFGYDIDKVALMVLVIDLFEKSRQVCSQSYKDTDFLFSDKTKKFDIILGNPPYVGMKAIDKEYSSKIKSLYGELYKDKGDLSYCFFGAAVNNLSENGKAAFISSRYFLESPSGEILRRTLKQECYIEKIVDFYGVRPFKNIGIDPVIVFFGLGREIESVQIIKPTVSKEKDFFNSVFNKVGEDFDSFTVPRDSLSDTGWILRDSNERNIISKIEKKCTKILEELCNSFQGIITGCDSAFIIDGCSIEEEGLEKEIIKPWIKSSSIKKDKVNLGEKYIIYSDFINSEDQYPNCIQHIAEYREKLMQRRECRKGIRKWYELQWGRTASVFEGEKIIFPYKSGSSRFALDKGSFFSADIYCMTLKKEASCSYDFLIKILNSTVYEYYFKTFAKKLGNNLYEYYPNNLMKLAIPPLMDIEDDVDRFLYDFFELSSSEITIVKSYVEN